VSALVAEAGGDVVAMSASNWASLGDEAALALLEADPERWRRFLHLEVEACREPGIVDAGTHLLFTARAGA
jgi:hypothetical protein